MNETLPRPVSHLCPDCRCTLFTRKEVDVPLTWKNTTVLVSVVAEECNQCFELLLDIAASAWIDAIKGKLRAGDFTGFIPIGTVYRAG
jgi:hypothetical protein